jgi:hypothetical protein
VKGIYVKKQQKILQGWFSVSWLVASTQKSVDLLREVLLVIMLV